MWAAFYLVFAVAAACAFYLGSRHQKLCAPSQPQQLRRAGWLLAALAWGASWRALGIWAGGFAMLTAFMLASVLLPYADAWLRVLRSAPDAQLDDRHVG